MLFPMMLLTTTLTQPRRASADADQPNNIQAINPNTGRTPTAISSSGAGSLPSSLGFLYIIVRQLALNEQPEAAGYQRR